MAVAVGVVGDAGAGKTRLVELLVPELRRRGLRVGYLKRASEGFDVDRPDSDTGRFRAAGAAEAVLVGPEATVRWQPPAGRSAATLAAEMLGSDVVLVEGFGAHGHPKARVRRVGRRPRAVAGPLLADLERRGDWTEAQVLALASQVEEVVAARPRPIVTVTADGADVPVAGFAEEVIASAVTGTLSALRGVEGAAELTVTVRSGRR